MAKIPKGDLLEKLTPVLLIVSIVLAFVVGILWQKVSSLEGGGARPTVSDTAPAQPDINGKLSEEQAGKVPKVGSGDFVRGNPDADIILLEYSDLECPFCARFHPTALQAIEEYGDQVAWVYRHFPLDTIHPWAIPSANAAECVGDLGGSDAFWTFVDYVFENQQTALSESGLATAAGIAGVDSGAFSSCYEASKFSGNVDSDYQSGLDAGVTGTPGNFVINKKGEVWIVPGAVPYETLKGTIEEALNS